MNIAKWLFKPRKKPKSKLREVYKTLYPESVRYALQYKGAKMGKIEMRDMLTDYAHEVVYLVTKALAPTREEQRGFLEHLTQLYIDPDWTMDDLRDMLRSYITPLPDDVAIDGAKLAQLNRSGSGYWQSAFRNLAENMYAEDPDALPCLIAHTPVFALHHFIEVYRQNPDTKLLMLVPAWMEDPEEVLMGYEFNIGEKASVHYHIKDECLFGSWACFKHDCPLHHKYCKTALFVDDTINTGSTAGKLRSFWKGEYGLRIPDEQIRVITDLRDKGYPKAKPRPALNAT
jgi:hypothetical protein